MVGKRILKKRGVSIHFSWMSRIIATSTNRYYARRQKCPWLRVQISSRHMPPKLLKTCQLSAEIIFYFMSQWDVKRVITTPTFQIIISAATNLTMRQANMWICGNIKKWVWPYALFRTLHFSQSTQQILNNFDACNSLILLHHHLKMV